MAQKVQTAVQSNVFKSGPRRLRMRRPPTPPPAPRRLKDTEKKSGDKPG